MKRAFCAVALASALTAGPALAQNDLFIYPKKGQS